MSNYETYTQEERIAYKTKTREIFSIETIHDDGCITIKHDGDLYHLDAEQEVSIGDDWSIVLSHSMTSVIITYVGFTKYPGERNTFAFPVKLGICYLHGEAPGYDGVKKFYFKFVDKVDQQARDEMGFDSIREIVDTSLMIRLRSFAENPIVSLFVNRDDVINNMSGIFPGYETNVTPSGDVSYIIRTSYFSPFLIVEFKDGRRVCYIHKGYSIDNIRDLLEEDELLRI